MIASDLAGNTRNSTSIFNVTVDAVAPQISIVSPANDTHRNNATVEFTFSVSDFTTLQNCSLWIDGSYNQSAGDLAPGAHLFIATLEEGAHNWSVACNDSAGNANTSENTTLIIDLTPPGQFWLLSPENDTISSNATPLWDWNETTDPYFASYQVFVDDDPTFASPTSFFIYQLSNTSVLQEPPLADGTWYWRVEASDEAGNTRNSTPAEHTYIVDTAPPDAFDLFSPTDDVQERNDMPLFTWQASDDVHFTNYTLLVSDDPAFGHVNASINTTGAAATNASLPVSQNVTLYWRVIAADVTGNMRNSTSTFQYLADYGSPMIALDSPANASAINLSSLVNFRFNVSDVGRLANCSLWIDGTLDKFVTGLPTGSNTIASALWNGNHSWYITCTDEAGNTGTSVTWTLTMNVSAPSVTLYESTPGSPAFTSTSRINLSEKDDTEGSVGFSVAGQAMANAVNATITVGGAGLYLFNGTIVNFTGYFSQSSNNVFVVTWKLLRTNSTGTATLCQYGDDANGGIAIGTTAKKQLTASCAVTSGEQFLVPGENLTLVVDVYNSGGTTRSFTHYWESTSDSSVRFDGYLLGLLSTSFFNATDPLVSETGSYVERCNVTCIGGACLVTNAYLEHFNGSAWVNVSTVGNVTLNGTQTNPVGIGNVNATSEANFSLYGNLHSLNNSLRCSATSQYSDVAGPAKNVSVIDRTPPTVTLLSPDDLAAFNAQVIPFTYQPYDRRLANCSLFLNHSGQWQQNMTNATPTNGSTNSFGVFLTYGLYLWNVQCADSVGNTAFATSNRTIYIAADLVIESENISFSDTAPTEGQNVTIIATVENRGNITAGLFTVQFFDGVPGPGNQIGENRTLLLGALGVNATNVTWLVPIGSHDIFVVVDPPIGSGDVIEFDETNNIANRTLQVSIWQIYYGNASGNITLDSASNDTVISWFVMNATGNLYVSDTDTKNGISWTLLRPLGRTVTNFATPDSDDDFAEADTLLGTTAFNDSVNATYTLSGIPRALETFVIYSNIFTTVPIANSTEDGNYTTGILWDADDSINDHYDTTDKEDLVFVTKLSEMRTGRYGPVSYELRVPSVLREYYGTTQTVTLYYELQ